MDLFGIGAAIKGVIGVYFLSARATGRTTSMIESVKDGDRVIFADSREAERVRRILRDRKINVDCFVVDPKNLDRIFERGPSEGRTVFDHTWVERFYIDAIDRAQREIDHLSRQASGFGQAHYETKMAAAAIAKWHEYVPL